MFRSHAAWFVGVHSVCVGNSTAALIFFSPPSKGLRYEHCDHSTAYTRSDRTGNSTTTRCRAREAAGEHRRTTASHAFSTSDGAALHCGRTRSRHYPVRRSHVEARMADQVRISIRGLQGGGAADT